MRKEPALKLIQVNRNYEQRKAVCYSCQQQKNEEDEDTDSNFSVNIPSTPDALTLLTQAMSSLLTSIEYEKRSRRQAEAERKLEEKVRQEFEDARLRHREQIKKDCQARLESLEGTNAEREAAAIEAHTKASEMHKAQHQTDLASQKKQAILQALPKLDD